MTPRDRTLIQTPPAVAPEAFMDAEAAVLRLEALYAQATRFLVDKFSETLTGERPPARVRAFYPRGADHHDQPRHRRQPVELWPCAGSRHLCGDDHPA